MDKKNYVTGGEIIDRETSVYVSRPMENEWIDEVKKTSSNSAYSVIAHRQMGKSSLLRRLMDDVTADGWVVAKADLRWAASRPNLDEIEFTRTVAEELLEGHLSAGEIDEALDGLLKWEKGGPKPTSNALKKCLRLACNAALNAGKPTLFIIDEFEAVSHLGPYVQALFELTLAVNNTPAAQPIVWVYAGTQPVETLVAAEGADPSRYPNFIKHELVDFSVNSDHVIAELSKGLTFESPSRKSVVEEVLADTSGHPLLTQKILDTIQREHERGRAIDVSSLLVSDEIMSNSHFKYAEKQLFLHRRFAGQALFAYKKLLEGQSYDSVAELTSDVNKEEVKRTLLQSGLTKLNRDQTLSIRSPIYRRYHDTAWANSVMRGVYAQTSNRQQAESTAEKEEVNRQKIGIINAGGTMGFDYRYGQVVPPTKGVYWYLSDPEMTRSTILVDLEPGFEPLDGVDVSPEQWKQISTVIFEKMYSDYAGFIVVMGTDSLAYAASATAFALGKELPVPVVFTGSQAPHAMYHADARVNLLRSIEVVRRLGKELTEVCVLFGEDVFRAVRVEKYHDYRFNGFHSPSFPALATIGEVPKLTNVRDRISPKKSASREVDAKIYADFDDDVLRISLYPGLKRKTLMAMLEGTPPSGLVFECLGLGNIPSRGEYDLLPVFDWCKKNNIPVLLTGRYPIAEEFVDQYAAATAPRERGAMSAGNMTPAAALTKFMWVLARVKDEASRVKSLAEPEARTARISSFFNESFVGEQDGID